METAYKNWRGMQESGGRRIMRSIRLDQNAVKFCTPEMIKRYGRIDLITEYIASRQVLVNDYKKKRAPSIHPWMVRKSPMWKFSEPTLKPI